MSNKVKYNGKVFERRVLAAQQMAKDMLGAKDPLVRRFAVTALSDVGRAEALKHVEDFLAALHDEDRGVRYWALIYLAGARSFSGPSPVAEHTADLVPPLSDEDPGIRYWALEALGAQGFASQPQVEDIMKCLNDTDPHCRVAAAKALLKVDPELEEQAASVLVTSLDADEPFFRMSSIEGLGLMGPSALPYVPKLREALGDDHGPVRLAATNSLRGLGREAVEQAAEQLAQLETSDPEKDVRLAASAALSKLDTASALCHLDVVVRRFAALCVSKLGEKAAEHRERLAVMLREDEDEVIRYYAAVAFSAMGPPAAEFAEGLRAALGDKNPDVWPPAMQALVRNVPKATEEALVFFGPILRDEEPHRRAQAVTAMGAARDDALPHCPPIVELLEDEEAEVRKAAMEALVNIGQRGVRKGDKIMAKMAQTDPDNDVRRRALHLLRHYFLAGKFGLDGL
eukprot:TRINITY_DN72407_c0_g1_i1.p1 TRINITY_DN72407_c0_g1~~TRINITY_DN72407_c0_g1_i1.p1  ORF type:complete len:474 (+),score=104.19 TRINITY_DN72407_c0_g1_i1:54-1424(+)